MTNLISGGHEASSVLESVPFLTHTPEMSLNLSKGKVVDHEPDVK
jgi:hypothetical protein